MAGGICWDHNVYGSGNMLGPQCLWLGEYAGTTMFMVGEYARSAMIKAWDGIYVQDPPCLKIVNRME